VQQQAAMLAFIDVFHVLMIVVILAMPLLLVMRGSKGGVSAH
jgi:DHA2 family multidrug resistance protein